MACQVRNRRNQTIKMKKQLLILLVAVASIGYIQDAKAQDDPFMTFNYYPEYTLGLGKKEMLDRYKTLKDMKQYSMLMLKKFDYYGPSFQYKNDKVYGYSGYLFLSNQLSNDDPAKTNALTTKHLKKFTEMFQFEPKISNTSSTEKGFATTTTTYTWEKNTKRFILTEISGYDEKRVYYGFISIASTDESLAK